MRAVEDHHVDRPGVEAQQCVKLTGTNRSIGLISSDNPRPGQRNWPDRRKKDKTRRTQRQNPLNEDTLNPRTGSFQPELDRTGSRRSETRPPLLFKRFFGGLVVMARE
jgi:hypothetical protein